MRGVLEEEKRIGPEVEFIKEEISKME